MPNDLYVWEAQNGLNHHCPQCFKPLTDPGAKRRCVGKHVECCKRYHCQLFKKGTSQSCKPCIASEEEQHKRHRQIAELIRDIKEVKEAGRDALAGSALAPMSPNICAIKVPSPGEHHLGKKERKAGKKIKKLTDVHVSKGVTNEQVEAVRGALHPHEVAGEGLEDPDVLSNRPFHAGTSNRREIRIELVKKDRHTPRGESDCYVGEKDLDGVLQVLDVSPPMSTATAEEQRLRAKLRTCIVAVLVQSKNESEELMMRKAGFWRWASKKTYKRLLASGFVTALGPSTTSLMPRDDPDSVNSSSLSATMPDLEADEFSEPETDVETPVHKEPSLLQTRLGGLTIAAGSITNTTRFGAVNHGLLDHSEDDGWTRVGKPSKTKVKKTTLGKVTLAHNGGLAKVALSQSSSPDNRYGRLIASSPWH